MKKKLVNNFGYKVLSVVLAIMLWLTIINVIDPYDDELIAGIPVELINQETLTDMGYTFEVLEGSTVSINVYGPKSVIDSLTSSDFYAYADFSTISPLSDYVDIQVKCVKSNVASNNVDITLKNSEVKINVENRESRTIDVDVALVGEAAPGFVAGDFDVSPMSIKVTGAESVVESIAMAVAEYDISGASLDISDNVALKLYDEDGVEIDKSNIILSREDVRLKVPILVKKEVPVNYAYSGTVKDGYKISGMECSQEKVVIAGTASAVEVVKSIDLPAELINVNEISADTTYSVRISHYVPSNVKILSEATSDVVIKVQPIVSKEFVIPTSNIEFKNTNEAYSYEFIRNSVNVSYEGLASDIAEITADGIKGSVDVEGLGVGNHVVKLKLESANNCTVSGEYTLTITVSR